MHVSDRELRPKIAETLDFKKIISKLLEIKFEIALTQENTGSTGSDVT